MYMYVFPCPCRIYFLLRNQLSRVKNTKLCTEAATKLQKFQFILVLYMYKMWCIYRSIGREVVSQILLCGSVCNPTNKNLHSIVVSLKITKGTICTFKLSCNNQDRKYSERNMKNLHLRLAEFESILLDLGHEVLPALDQSNNERTTTSWILKNIVYMYTLYRHLENTEPAQAVDIMLVHAKIIYSLIIIRHCVLKEMENMFSMFLFSYRTTHENLGELEKAVKTLACGSCSHSSYLSSKLPLCFYNLLVYTWKSTSALSQMPFSDWVGYSHSIQW